MERLDRRSALRLAAASGAVAAGWIADPAAAWAGMGSRFDPTLTLTDGGRVLATGPLGLDLDETQARVSAHVAQRDQLQHGVTAWVHGASWRILLSGPALKPGPADAYGLAYVEVRDGTFEWYPWQMRVTLR